VLLSDGTGNSAAKAFKTNVWRVYQALDLREPDVRAFYDDGVGTGRFAPMAIVGSAVGFGLAQNVRDLYTFLCRNYEKNDAIYAFGFSRGAFTIRTLIGLVTTVGLVKADTEAELSRLVAAAYREQRKRFKTNWTLWYEELFGKTAEPRRLGPIPSIHFLGLWDTVAAYGLPIDELQRGIDRYFRSHSFPDRELSGQVDIARHALSLDDERRTFHPVLWSERKETNPQRIQQVWFAGVHSDVGGGYPKEALSYVSLEWIMREAERAGLRFKPGAIDECARLADPHGELHDSRSGLAAYYRYAPRSVSGLCNDTYANVHIERPKIHESVFARIGDGRVAYAPLGIPAEYDILRADGTLVPGPRRSEPQAAAVFEGLEDAGERAGLDGRASSQERAWDFVWYRRILYFVTLAASMLLALFPKIVDASRHEHGPLAFFDSHVLSPLGATLPNWLQPWIAAFSAAPGWMLCAVSALLLSWTLSAHVEARIDASAELAWRHLKHRGKKPEPYRRGLVYRLRSSRLLVAPYLHVARSAVPFAFAVTLGIAGLAAANHAAFAMFSVLERECSVDSATIVGDQPMHAQIDLKDGCNATKLRLEAGATYEFQLEWADERSVGFSNPLDFPLRRLISRPWGALILKVGSQQSALHESTSTGRITRTVVTAEHGGDVFLFANDAVIALPKLWNSFYADNQGQATLQVTRLKSGAVLSSTAN
jgi:uncharacterized protein (DUF2235 family)